MERDKQIEEMAKILIEIQQDFNEYCAKPCRECELGGVVNCESHYKATALYNAGYRKAEDVAREIFEEIEKLLLNNHIESFKNFHDNWNYRFKVDMMAEFAELKKKYIGEDTNVTTNTEDGK